MYKDPEKAKARNLKYAKEHAEERRQKTREWCKKNPDKKRAWDLSQLGWTLEMWNAVLSAQDGVCAVCKQPEVSRRLAADHEHVVPPRPRGLLCSECNKGLGMFKDNPSLLEAAAAYLRKYGAK